MKKIAMLMMAMAALSFAFAACGKTESDHDHDHDKKSGSHSGGDGHDHDEEDNHDHSGMHNSIGKATLAGVTFDIEQVGEVEAGHGATFESKVTDGDGAEMRVYFADANDVMPDDTAPSKAHVHTDGAWGTHPKAPAKLEGILVWVEITKGDKTEKKSFPIHK